MMQMGMSLNLSLSQCLLMDITGGAVETVLPRTERALNRCVNAQRLLSRVASGYRSLVDAVLGLSSPAWDAHVQDFYNDRGLQLRFTQTQDTITAIDEVLCLLVRELAALERNGWEDCPFWDEALLEAMGTFVAPYLPLPEPMLFCLETNDTARDLDAWEKMARF